jgi:nucleoside phosphorylase
MYLPFDGGHLDYAKKAIAFGKNYSLEANFDFQVVENAFCLTGDQFIDDAQKVEMLASEYQTHVIEMEAFAIASVAREFGSLEKLICIKAVSD